MPFQDVFNTLEYDQLSEDMQVTIRGYLTDLNQIVNSDSSSRNEKIRQLSDKIRDYKNLLEGAEQTLIQHAGGTNQDDLDLEDPDVFEDMENFSQLSIELQLTVVEHKKITSRSRQQTSRNTGRSLSRQGPSR